MTLPTIRNKRTSYIAQHLLAGLSTLLFSTATFANPVLAPTGSAQNVGNFSVQQNANTTTINQTSQKAIINWQSFNIGAQEHTHFQQPTGGVALNRINPSQGASQIYGRLTASGQIILVNPAGIFFAPGSYVNVGGLIATTANISDQDFLNNYYHFTKDANYNGAIINQGTIIAANNGLIALIGGAVSNDGYIQANYGHAILASGDSFTMTFAGNDLVSFAVDSGVSQRSVDKDGNALPFGVKNTGHIVADGGQILMTAKDAAHVLDNVIDMQGVAQAHSVEEAGNKGDGEIYILGEDGTVQAGGLFDASSHNAFDGGKITIKAKYLAVKDGAQFDVSSSGGNGGFIETSASQGLQIGDIKINTSAPMGKTGNWLIDPADITITAVNSNITGSTPFTATGTGATLNVATLVAALANTNVTVQTTNDGFAGNGDIIVNSGITWTSTNTLLLQAYRNIVINAPISGINGSLNLNAANSAQSVTTGASGTIDVGNFNLIQGQWYQVGTLPSFNVRNSFTLSNDSTIVASTARFLRAAGGDGSTGNPYQLTDIYGLQGINSGSANDMVFKSYKLINDIDASGTRTWNNGAGFHPIGYFSTGSTGFEFNGNFDGNNKVINGLYINRSQYESASDGEMGAGLFAVTWAPQIFNLGLTNVDITSQNNRAGALVAFASWQSWWTSPRATFTNIYVTGKVTSNVGFAGGILGYFGDGTLSNSYNAATVTGLGGSSAVGGVVAFLGSGGAYTAAQNNYNVGLVRNLGTGNAGGIAGAANAGTEISYSYNAGQVIAVNGSAGGIIGVNSGINIAGNFWDTDSSLTSISSGSGSSVATGGCFSGTCTNGGTANLSAAATFSGAGWSIANTGFTGSTPPAGTWLIIDGQTRPMLRAEWNTNIHSAHQLQLMYTAPTASYTLANNIDLSSNLTNTGDVWNTNYSLSTGAGFLPVGNATTNFSGTFNGQNNVISNLYIYRPTTEYIGLFGFATNTLQQVGLSNVNITGQYIIGGLVGYAMGSINNSYVKGGYVTGSATGGDAYWGGTMIGGLIGIINSGGSANTLYSTATVSGLNSVGGLIGYNNASISNSYSSGNVIGANNASAIGGLVGTNVTNGPSLTNVYSGSNITVGTGSSSIGGLVGNSTASGSITNAYSVGTITAGSGSNTIGGLVGASVTPIINTYSSTAINVTGGSNMGGLVGTFANVISNSFWDSVTTGQTSGFGTNNAGGLTNVTNLFAGCFAAGGTCATQTISNATLTGSITPKDLTLASTYTTGGPTWDITKTPSSTATAPANTWYIFDATNANIGAASASSYTRPILMMEYQTNITNAHGLQLMGSTLGGNYTLANDLDLTNAFNNASEIWGTNRNTFTGYGFVAAGYSYQANANASPPTQFVGTFNGNNHIISNLYVNKPILGDDDTGGLFIETGNGASISNLTLMNIYVQGASGGYASQGGLVGVMRGGSINNVSVYGTVAGTGGNTGGLVGNIDSAPSTVSNSTFNGTVNAVWILNIGGLAGTNSGSISNSYSSGSVIRTNTRDSQIGGLVGTNNGTISNSYSVSNVDGGPVSSASTTTGGLIGLNTGTINNSYSSGSVTSVNTYGGFIGNNVGTVNSSVWDTVSSGQSLAIGGGSSSGIVGMTTTQMMTLANFTTPGNGFVTSAWDITGTPSATSIAPTNTWFSFDGTTRPMLMMEHVSNIVSAHQLQMMGAATGGVYTLGSDVDFGTAATNNSEVWGGTTTGAGFSPIAYGSSFTGSLDGQNHTINKFNYGLPANANLNNYGLISSVGVTGAIANIAFTNSRLIGNQYIGIVATNNGYINHITNSGTIQSSQYVGGIAGVNNGLIESTYFTGSMQYTTTGTFGGIVGTNTGTIYNSYNAGNVTAAAYSGGIAASNSGMIANSYNTGKLDASGAGGLGIAGGVVATNTGTIVNSYNLGYVLGPVTAGGIAATNSGSIIKSYNAGVVSASTAGGIAGTNSNAITSSFWDTATSGQASAVGTNTGTVTATAGTFDGSSGANLSLASTYTGAGWDFTAFWTILPNHSYPYLKYFYATAPRAIGITSSVTGGNLVNLVKAGTQLEAAYTGANGFSYFMEGNNTLAGNNTIADNTMLLAYLSGGATKSNVVTAAPVSGGSLSQATGLTFTNSTVTAGNSGTSIGLSNSQLSTAKGSLVDSDILYSVTSNNLNLASSRSFLTTSGTAYTVDGNIAATSADILFNGGVIIGSAAPIISTTTSGNITFANTVTGGGNSFTVSNPASSTVAFSNVISGSGTALTKTGAGLLTLGSTSSSFTGGVFLNGGTLSTASLPSAAGNSIIGTGNLTIDNASILSYTGATGTFNRAITVGSGGGTIQTTNGSANTLTLSGGIATSGALTFNTTGAGPANITITNTGISGSGSLVKSGTGTLTINVAGSNYTGTTTVSSGALVNGVINALPTTTALSVTGSGSYNLAGFNQTVSSTSGSGTITSSSGTPTFTTNDSGIDTFSGLLSGSIGLTMSGSGTLKLSYSGTNTYSGNTIISSGTLQAGSAGAIPSGVSAGNVSVTGILDLNGFNIAMNGLSGAGTIDNVSAGGTASLTVGNNNQTSSFTGLIKNTTGTLSLIKTGSGSLTLSNTNTFSGGSAILAGSLIASTSASALGSGTVTVGDSAGGSNNASLLLGTDLLSIANPIVLASNTTGTLSLGANISLSGTFTGGVTGNNNLTINNTATGTTVFTTNSVNNAGTITNTGGTLTISGGIGSNVTGLIHSSSGSTTVNSALNIHSSGTFLQNNNGTVGQLTVSGGITGTGNLSIINNAALAGGITISGSAINNNGTITQTGTGTGSTIISAAINSNVTNITLNTNNSALTVSGLLTVNASGTTLVNNSTSKILTVSGGVSGTGNLILQNNTTLASGITMSTNQVNNIGTITNAGTGSGSVVISTSVGSNVTGINETAASSGLTISGALNVNSGGTTLTNTGSTISVTGGVTGTGNLLLLSNASSGSISLGGSSVNNTGTITNASTSGAATISAVIGTNVTGVIQNSASSTLVLSGNNTYTSGTTILQGTVRGQTATAFGAASSVITLGNNAGGNNAASISIGTDGLTIANPILLASNTTGALSLTNNFNISTTFTGGITGNNNLQVQPNGTTGTTTFSGAAINNAGTLTFSSNVTSPTNISSDIGSNVTNIIQNSKSPITVTGTLNVNSSIGTRLTNNLALGAPLTISGGVTGTGNLILQNNNTQANGIVLSTTAINNTGTITNSGSSSGSVSISAAIGLNVTNVIQNSSLSVLTLSGVNAYSGNTVITLGTLKVGNSQAITSGSGSGNVSVTGTLDVNGFNVTMNGLSGAGTIDNVSAGGTPSLSIGNNNQTSSFSGLIKNTTGTLSVVKAGSGTLTLSNASSSYSGGTSINNGILSVASLPNAAGNSVIGTGNLSLNTGTLSYTGATGTFNRAITVNAGGGTLQTTNAAANTLTITGGITNNGSLVFDTTGAGPTNISVTTNGINGTGSIIKNSAGTLTLNTANSFSGGVTLNAGTLSIGNSTALGTGVSSTLIYNGGTIVANTTGINIANNISLNAGISFGGSNDFTLSGNISGANGITQSGTNTLSLTGSNSYTTTLISSGSLRIGAGGTSGTLGSGDVTNNGALIFNRTDTMNVTNLISGTGTLTQNGIGGIVTLSNANSYTGKTTINAGTLSINTIANAGSNSSLGAPAAGANSIIDIGAGTLQYTGAASSSSRVINLTASGATIDASGSGTLTLSGGITGAGNSLILTGSGSATESGVISNTSATLTKNGVGTWTLSNAGNTYGNGNSTIINAGTLSVSSDGALGALPGSFDATNIQIGGGGILQTTASFSMNANRGIFLNAGGATIQSTSGTLTLPNAINTNGNALIFDTNTGNITSSGGIGGAGSLTKSSTGTLTLNTANTYSGGTTINGGIVIAGNNTALSNGTISINTGSTLKITNGITLGNALILNGTTGASGTNGLLDTNGTGTATVSGVITLAGDSAIGAASGGILNIANTIDGTTNGGQSLTTNGVGNVKFSAAVGNGTNTALNTLTAFSPVTLSAGNIITTGAQAYNAITMAGATTLTSSGSSITLGGAVSGAFDLALNAGTSVTFGSTGASLTTSVNSLSVTAPSGIYMVGNSTGSYGITTINNLSFNSPAYTSGFLNVTLTTTGGGDLSMSSYNKLGNDPTLAVHSSGKLTLNGGINTDFLLDFTGTNGIFINTTSSINSFHNIHFNSPVTLLTDATFTANYGLVTFYSTVNGAHSLVVSNDAAGLGTSYTLSTPIGNITPLTSLQIVRPKGDMIFSAPIDVNGPVTLTASSTWGGNGAITLASPIGSNSTVTSLSVHGSTGINFNAGSSTTTSGNQVYDSGPTGSNPWQGPILLGQDTTLTSTGGSITFLRPAGSLTGLGVNSDTVGTPRNLTLNSATGVNFQVLVGNTAPLNSLTVNGVAIIDNQATQIITNNAQSYNNGVTLGVGTTLKSLNGADISFGTNLIAGTINGNASLSINTGVSTPGNVTFWGAVGNTTALSSLSVNGSSINVRGGSIRTSGAQTYNNLVTLFADTTLTSTANSISLLNNVTSDAVGTPRSLTLTSASTTILTGNLGLPNLLNALTITNTSSIGAAIHTLGAQSFGGAMTLTANSSFTSDSGDVTISSTVDGGSSNSLTINNAGASSSVAGIISNLSDLIMAGSGTLTLTANNTYTGTTHINSGTLQVGNGGATGALGSDTVTNNGSLIFNRNNGLTIAGVITGSGSVTQAGSGTTIIANNNNYTGGTTISAGTLQIGNGGATGAITGTIANSGALVFNTSNSFTLANTVTGTGSLTQAGSGTLTLTGVNSYTGTTGVTNGVLEFDSIGNAGTNTALGNSSAAINVGAGTLRYVGTAVGGHTSTRSINVTASGATINASGTGPLALSGGMTGTNTNITLTGTGSATQSGVIATGSGTLTKNGAGTWTLSNAANSYSGGTIINGGTLSQPSLPSAAGNSTIGTGNLTLGGGTLSYTGSTATFNRAITVGGAGGTIQTTNASANTLTISGGIVTNGALTFNTTGAGPTNITVTTTGISGSGSIVKSGTGTLTLNIANTYNSGTTLNGGIIIAGNNTALSSGAIAINTGNTLKITNGINLGNAITLNGTTGASGTNGLLDTNGTGTATASGVITLAGDSTIGAASGGILNLTNTVDGITNGGQSLTTSGAGNVTFAAAVGNGTNTALNNFTANSPVTLNAGTVKTVGAQTYNSSVTLTGNNTLSSTTSSIYLAYGINGAFDLVVNAATSATFGTYGTTTFSSLKSLNVTAPSGITVLANVGGSMNITTTNDLVFNNAITTSGWTTGVFTTTGGGNISLPSYQYTGRYTGLTVNSSGTLTLNGGISLIDNAANFTATNGIFINSTGGISAQGGITFNSPLTLLTDSSLNAYYGNIVFNSSVNGAHALTITPWSNGSGATYTISSAIGNITPLSSLSVGRGAGDLVFNGSIDVNGAISLSSSSNFGGGVVYLAAPIGASSSVTSLYIHGANGIRFNAGSSVTTSGNQVYDSGPPAGQGTILLGQDTTLTSTAGSIAFWKPQSGGLTGLGINSDAVGTPRSLTINAANGVNFQILVGNTAPLNNLTVNGVATIDNQATQIITNNAQSYNNGIILGVGTTLKSLNGADISFGTNLIAGTINGNASLSINTGVSTPGNVTFWGAVGDTTALSSLSVNGSSINVRGGSIRTSGTQTYNNLVTLFADTTLTSTANSISLLNNVTSDAVGTPRSLTLTSASATILTGNLGLPNLLNALTITNTSSIGAAIHTLGAQSFGGAMTLTANSSFTSDSGDVTISSTVDGGSTNSLTINNAGASSSIAGIISNLSDLIMAGSGTLTLTANNTYSGTTHINSGTLRVGNGGAIGALGTGTVTTNSSLIFNRNNTLTVAGVIDGTGTVTQAGTGTTILANNNSYTGGTTISAGTLQIGNGGGTGAITGAIANSGALVFNTSNSFTLANAVTGSGSLTQSGSGTLTLTGTSSYTGTTGVTNGVLAFDSIGDAGTNTALGNSSAAINVGAGTLRYVGTAVGGHTSTRSINVTASGAIIDASGTGPLVLSGGITGTNTNVTLSGTGNGTQSGVIATTSGTVTKNGTGTWILSGANTYSGTTAISNGTLSAANATALGTTAGNTTVATGATLDINNVAIGAETILLGSAGIGSATLTGTGVASLAGDVNMQFATLFGGTGSLTLSGQIIGAGITMNKNDSGTLILTGTNNSTGAMNINSGTLQIGNGSTAGNLSIGATITNNAALVFNRSDSYNPSSNTITGTGTVTQAGSGTLTLSNNNNSYSGATSITNGTLSITSVGDTGTNSSIGNSSAAINIGAGTLQYTGTGHTSSRAISLTASNATINASGSGALTLSGGVTGNTFNLALTGSGNATQSGVIATTTGTVSKSGTGTWTLSGANTYSGATNVTGGTLEVTNSNALGGGVSATTVSNSTLALTGSLNLANPITLNNANVNITTSSAIIYLNGAINFNSGSNTFDIASLANTSIQVASTGSGNLVKTGAGQLNLVGARSAFNGNIIVNQGDLETDNSTGLGSTAGTVTINSGASVGLNSNAGALSFDKAFILNNGSLGVGSSGIAHLVTISATGSINLASGTNTLNTNSNPFTINGVISGSGNLNTTGNDVLTFTAINTYSGNTNINGGTLSVASSANLGDASGTNNITFNGGTLANTGAFTTSRAINLIGNGAIDNGADLTISGAVSGNGALTKAGASTLILANDNTYTGGTTISAGTLQVGNGGATGSMTGAVVDNGALIFNTANNFTMNGIISGSGSVTQAGSGMVALSGNNTYQGATNINAGTIEVDHPNALGDVAGGTILANGATLIINGVNVVSEGLTMNGGALNGSGVAGYAGALTLNADTAISNTGGTFTLGGTIVGNQNLTLNGSGTTVLNGAVGAGVGNALSSVTANTALTIGGGSVITSGNQLYQNTVNATNDTTFRTTGAGSQSIVFNNAISGGSNVTLNGSNAAGSYTFTVGAITANNVDVSAAPGATNNVFNLNTGSTQNFNATSSDSGTVTGVSTVTGNFTYNNMQNINGGSGADNFVVSGGTFGNINGGAGNNSLTGDNVVNTFIVTSANGGTATGVSGTFANIQNLNGGSNADSFVLAGGTVSGNINGGAGNNSLTGDNVVNTFTVTSANGGSATGIGGTFSNIQNLTGGSSTDSFTLAGGTISGNVDGGAGTNNFTADNVTNSWNINTANGGTVTGVGGTFANIQNLIGGSGADTFTFGAAGSLTGNIDGGLGLNSIIAANNLINTWLIDNNNGGKFSSMTGSFSNIENLTGGTAADNFNFMPGFSISGIIDGGDSTDRGNSINFYNYDSSTILRLYLSAPVVPHVYEAGLVYNNVGIQLANFVRVQQSIGNNVSYITLPNIPNLKVSRLPGDSNPLNGMIEDPFYYLGWIIGNPPPVIPSNLSPIPYIAPIVNQPMTSANNQTPVFDDNYDDKNNDKNYFIINNTLTDPLLDTTTIKFGSACSFMPNY